MPHEPCIELQEGIATDERSRAMIVAIRSLRRFMSKRQIVGYERKSGYLIMPNSAPDAKSAPFCDDRAVRRTNLAVTGAEKITVFLDLEFSNAPVITSVHVWPSVLTAIL